jgi:predicted dehydrogenase
MQRSEHSRVVAIASRDAGRARAAADALGIARAYGSYEALLADPEIDAIYNPLPNHLHVPWSIRAAESGKHVLCEKPIALSAGEARELLAVRDRTGVQIGEAFMVRTHPQWTAVRELIAEERIGELRLIAGHFATTGAIRTFEAASIGRRRGCWTSAAIHHLSRWLFGVELSMSSRRSSAILELRSTVWRRAAAFEWSGEL